MGLKKKATQLDVARATGLDQGSVSRILNKETRNSFSKETVELVFRIARELGYLHPVLISSNRRSSGRKKTAMPCSIRIIVGTNTFYDEGKAVVSEVSLSGLLIKGIITKRNSLPLDKFKVEVSIESQPLKGLKARCEIVRFAGNEHELALALKYAGIDDSTRERLNKFLGR